MNGPEHYLEAERLLELAANTDWVTLEEPYRDIAIAAAAAHATLSLTAATAETVGLVKKPIPAGEGDPAYPGNDWGRAIYGDLPTQTQKDS